MCLPPVHPPVGRPDFINPHGPTRLILKEKVMSITGDAFEITLDPGNGQQPQPIFKVKPNWVTSKKQFCNMSNNHLFDLRKEHIHVFHEYMKLVDTNDNKFCQIKKNMTWGFGSKFTITFLSPGAEDQVLVMEGNWRDSTAQIKHEGSGQVCAEVHRKSAFKSLSTFLFDQQTYMVTIAPGVDYGAIAAICIAFDEWENEPTAA